MIFFIALLLYSYLMYISVSYTHLDVSKRQVQGKGELVVKPEQAFVVTQILDAIYESARTGKAVYFD